MPNMNYGEVIRIRVSPQDVMAAIDIVDELGLYIHGMSLSQCVSVALKAVFESCRHTKLIPTRDGFEYSAMLSRYPRGTEVNIRARGRQIDITKAFQESLGEDNRVPHLAQYSQRVAQVQPVDYSQHENPEVRRLFRKLTELDAKKQVDPENFDQSEYDVVESAFVKLI